MSQSLMINNIFPKTDKEVAMVLSCHCHLTPQTLLSTKPVIMDIKGLVPNPS